eukprot:1178869-Prorocentrum_minimum.AAC.2
MHSLLNAIPDQTVHKVVKVGLSPQHGRAHQGDQACGPLSACLPAPQPAPALRASRHYGQSTASCPTAPGMGGEIQVRKWKWPDS